MLPWRYEQREALTRHVRAGFESDIYDGAGVTCTSIAIFCFRLSVAIRAVRLTFKRPDSFSLKEILQADPSNPSREGGCKNLGYEEL